MSAEPFALVNTKAISRQLFYGGVDAGRDNRLSPVESDARCPAQSVSADARVEIALADRG